jgi:hypothetical protein
MLSSKTLTCKGIAAGVYLPRTPLPPPPLHTVYVNVYRIFIDRERGKEGEVNQREGGEGQQFTKLGRKYQQY